MPKSAKYLLIGSTEAFSGKSATIVGVAHQLQQKGFKLAYGKPLGTCPSVDPAVIVDEDVRFIAKTLKLPENRLLSPLVFLDEKTILQRLSQEDQTDYLQQLAQLKAFPDTDIVLIEGGGTLTEGSLLGLSLAQMASAIDAAVMLVVRFQSVLAVDRLVAAKQRLGERLIGLILNDVPAEQIDVIQNCVRPFLESQGMPVLGLLPRSGLLRSASVGELVHRLNADVLCRPDRLDLMVESLKIGAMNVNSAMKYFSAGRNMAVVTGGDRTDIQMAALDNSTQCLILTGHIAPSPMVLNRAEEIEVPVLSVDLDTLTTVEIVEQALGHVRLQEPIKVHYMLQMMSENCDVDRLLTQLSLEPASVS